MKQSIFTIKENRPLTDLVWLMRMAGDTSEITAAGQFVNIQLDGLYLRRPISVFDCEDGMLSIIYKVVGKGTEKMTTLPVGTELDVLTGLGNGYDLEKVGKNRGFMMRGGEINTERTAITLLEEFRSGKIGRITLEIPPK